MRRPSCRVLDDSKVTAHNYTGAVIEQARLGGAHVSRIMHPPGQRIGAHAHDWPVLALYRIGSFRERTDEASISFDGPSVVLQPAGAAHADEIGARGLETLSLRFDPAWLAPGLRAVLPRTTLWRMGGPLGAAAGRLARVWLTADEAGLRAETSRFLARMLAASDAPARPSWAAHVDAALEDGIATAQIAGAAKLHPAWLARAYRAWRGEGMGETLRRRRVERAMLKLRGGTSPLADIAAECGFCDQSHMNRAFRAVLGRTPLDVRREATLLAQLSD
jgi:AraC family transcriptional regulator